MLDIDRPPANWQEILQKSAKSLSQLLAMPEVSQLLSKANQKYLHWDKFRYQPMPKELSPALAWALLKISRLGNREILPITMQDKLPFSVFLSKFHLKQLSHIDSHTSGMIASAEQLPSGAQKDQLIINGLIEEAISSSQIEGANTTRKVAKAMIELNRSPKNKDERMILNNYLAMNQIETWKHRKLDDDFLLELHQILSAETMDEPADEGRFRNDSDEVVVSDKRTGNVVHTPPLLSDMKKQLRQLYDFANADHEDAYIHPFVKASILHFCLGYIHPFVDGNGRCARAIFYWYLLKQNYWMFKFLPISLQIKKQDSRPGYDRAFQYVESDEGDITYFLNYKLKVACNAIDDFKKYLEKKQKAASKLKEKLVASEEVNERQLELIAYFQRNPNANIDLQTYKERNKIAYQTARTDVLGLATKGVLKQVAIGKKFVFMRGENFPSS